MLKLLKVKVNTPKGERTLLFREIPKVEEYSCMCDSVCPYKGLCDYICDPRDPENKESTFLDFCSSLGEEIEDSNREGREGEAEAGKERKLLDSVPVEGTIEKNLSDFPDVVQNIISKNPVVRVKDIITNVCSEWCDMYTEDCSNCKQGTEGCFLKNIIKLPEHVGGEKD